MPEEINYTGNENVRGASREPVRADEVRPIKRVSWPAIFGGTMVALGTEILFLTFGLAIAFIIYNPGGVQAWSTAWYLITSIIALYAGGWVAARLSANPDRGAAQLHGLITWGLTTLTNAVILMTSAWDVLKTSASMLATTVSATPQGQQAAQQAAAQAPPPSAIAQMIASRGWVLALILFGGVLLAMGSSWIGGAAGKPATATRE